MNKIQIYLSFFLISITGFLPSAMAQNTYKLTVDELLDKGMKNSLGLQSAYLQQQIAKNKVTLAKNKQIPDIQMAAQFGFVGTPTILDTDLSFLKHSNTPDWKQNYQISATQPIYQGGRIKNNIRKAILEETVAELSVYKNQSDLKLWLITKYLNLYTLYEKQIVYTHNIKEAQKRLQDIEVMKKEGIITANDVLRSEIVLTDYQLSANEISNDIAIASQQLSIAMGMDEELIYTPDSTFLDAPQYLSDFNQYVQEAYINYPDLRISKTNTDIANNNLKIVKADYLPTLSLQVGNTFQRPIPNTSPVQDLYINSWAVTLNLSYRISALFDRKSSLLAAKTQISVTELAQDQQKQNIRMKVKEAYLNHQEALDRINALEKTINQANENYRIVSNKYFNHLAILTDLLDANTVQLNSELQLTTAKANAAYTYYQLLNLSGKL